MRYKTKQNLWVLAFVLVVALNAFLFYRPTETAKMITEPGEACPEDYFYSKFDSTCTPFRNDTQKFLYQNPGCEILPTGVISCTQPMIDVAGSTKHYE